MFLDSLAVGMPARVDRSVFHSRFSAGVQSQINSGLRSLQLIDASGAPTAALRRLAPAKGDARRTVLQEVLKAYYAHVFMLDLEHATKSQLQEAIRKFGCTDAMLVKCESFFIHAATDAGIPLSPYITSNRKSMPKSASSSRANARATTRARPVGASDVPAAIVVADGYGVAAAADTLSPREFSLKLLEKFPEFDPAWPAETQTNWLTAMRSLQEFNASMLADAYRSSGTAGGQPDGA